MKVETKKILSRKVVMNYLKAICLSLFGLLAPIHSIIYATTVLIILDTVTGIWAAHKRGEKIVSAKFRHLVSKSLIYSSALISAFIVETYMKFDIVPVIQLTTAAIGSTELLSIIENLNSISGKDIFKVIKKAIGSRNLKED